MGEISEQANQTLQRALTAHKSGDWAAAEAAYRAYLEDCPHSAAAHMHLGVVLAYLRRWDEGAHHYLKAIQLHPHYAEAHGNLAFCLLNAGKVEEAEQACLEALKLQQNMPSALFSLGLIRYRQGMLDEARAAFAHLSSIVPDHVEALTNLASIDFIQGCWPEAEALLRRALQLNPAQFEAWNALGATLKMQSKLLDAEQCLRRAVTLKEQDPDALSNLGATLTALGRFDESQEILRRAIGLDPRHWNAHSNLLYAQNFCKLTSEAIRAQAQTYGACLRAYVQEMGGAFKVWNHGTELHPMRVGLVSGDLRDHPVGYFLENVLAATDSAAIQWYAYPNHGAGDDVVSQRLKSHCAAWRPLAGHDAASAARMIHADGLHILIDLSGHTGGNCLPLFAWKPAPLQITWLGYFATTGVAEIDYILVDPVGAPSEYQEQFTERLAWLPETRLCFTPPIDAPAVSLAPTFANGTITFGNMQNPAKINEAVLAAWAEILRRLPSARLRLQHGAYGDESVCQRLRETLQAQGIDAQRLSFHPGTPRADYLASYATIDILLDTFPYPGGTTTCEALWMGVPTVTLKGESLLARQGASLLTAAGLQEWIADDPDQYVAIALARAQDLGALVDLRLSLRERVRNSPLCDARRFAGHLTATLRALWAQLADAQSHVAQTQKIDNWLAESLAAHKSGRLDIALALMRQAAQVAPEHPQVLNNLAAFAAMAGETLEAAKVYQQLVLQQPENADAANNLGYILQRLQRPADAETAYRHALQVNPMHGAVLNNYGLLLKEHNRLDEAQNLLQRACASAPKEADYHNNLGDVLRLLGHLEEAETHLRQALVLDPHLANAHNNFGILYKQRGDFLAAEGCYRQAIAVAPDNPLAWNNLANLQKELGQAAEAEASYRTALKWSPTMAEARMNLGLLLLRQGRWEEGWEAHEARYAPAFRMRSKVLPPPLPTSGPCPVQWDGSSLHGKSVLVWPEQGFGDTLQFVRFLPQIKSLGVAKLTFACPRPLLPLLENQGLADEVIATDDWKPTLAAQFDVWTFLLSLPLHLGITLDNLSTTCPYLRADSTRVAFWQPRRPPGRLCVGLAWRGNPKHKNDIHRSLPGLSALVPFWTIPDIVWVSLQLQAGDEVGTCNANGHPCSDWGSEFTDFADSAAAISTLDLVICVDTAIAHLAGALGKPCWVMLPAQDTDWRWLEDREDSPWYPQVMRLFRQTERDGWASVVVQVSRALEAYRFSLDRQGLRT